MTGYTADEKSLIDALTSALREMPIRERLEFISNEIFKVYGHNTTLTVFSASLMETVRQLPPRPSEGPQKVIESVPHT
jgi:hypothetical protein